MSNLNFEQKVRVVSCLVEGNSVRSTERLCRVHRDTILRHLVTIGEGCNRVHDKRMQGLHVNLLELDEVWGYIGKKQKRVKPGDEAEMGDSYTFTALDATRKAIIGYAVGKRDGDTARAFALDLRARIVNRPQISTDGFSPYLDAIAQAFEDEVHYAMVFKEYGQEDGDDHKYSPPKCIAVEKKRISGDPDMDRAGTSYVERSNLTLRMGCRRFTRLTNGFSKKLRNHAAAVGLHHAYYNFVRTHETLKRQTPAMALGLTDRPWTIAQLIEEALAALPEEPEPGEPEGPQGPILTPPPAPLPTMPPIAPVLPAHVGEAARRVQAIAKQLSLFMPAVPYPRKAQGG